MIEKPCESRIEQGMRVGAQGEGQAGDIDPVSSSRPPSLYHPWVKFASLMALAGHIGQLACQIASPLLWTSGVWLAQATSAMEPEERLEAENRPPASASSHQEERPASNPFLDEEREELIGRILEATNAEPSPVAVAHRNPDLQSIRHLLIEPEELLIRGEKDNFREACPKTPDHPFFGGIIAREGKLAASGLCPVNVLSQYRSYRERCTTLGGADLKGHVAPKAILYIDDQRLYRIARSLAYRINSINEYNLSQRENDAGNHAVCQLGEPGRSVHFKNNNCHTDLSPAMESAMYGFYSLIAPRSVTPSFFMRIEGLPIKKLNQPCLMAEWNAVERGDRNLQDFINDHADQQASLFTDNPQNFILQGSRTAEGTRFDKFLEQVRQGEASYDAINRESFGYHILLSLLFNPSDYKADNLFLSPEGHVVGIDNDGCLANPIIYTGTQQREYYAGVKNVLYLLPLMDKPVHENVINAFRGLNTPLTLLRWMSFLDAQDKRHRTTFDRQGLERHIEDSHSFPVRLVPGTMTSLYEGLRSLQTVLADSWGLTHRELLVRLQPLVGEACQAHLKANPDPLQAMSVIYDRRADLRRLLPDRIAELQNEAMSKDAYTLNRTAFLEQEIQAVLPNLREDDVHLAQVLDYLVGHLSEYVPSLSLMQDPQRFKRMLAAGASLPSLRWLLANTSQNGFATLQWEPADLIQYARNFMPQIPATHLEGRLNPVLSLILDHFREWADDLLPVLSENAWQQVVQEQGQQGLYNKSVLDYVMKRHPKGLNRPDANNKTPLDMAFEHLKDASAEIVADLVSKGAWRMSLSGRQYRDLKKKEGQLPDSFWNALGILQERNMKVGWTATLEELFPIASKQGQDTIQGASGEIRLLTETLLRQMKDPHREITQGRRKVIQVDANGRFAYLKFYPELVGLEEAVGELARRIIGFGAPHGELFRFPDGTPVWISQGIPGQTLQWVLKNDPGRLTRLDPVSTANFILMAMLTNPEDGKPDNYIVEPLPDNPAIYRLASPDNDHGFVPAFVKSKPDEGSILKKPEVVVQVKTILYCLDLMNQPIPDATKALFLKGDPLLLMEEWLNVLDRRNRRYEGLYPDSAQAAVLFRERQCFLGIPFQKGMIDHLYSKWIRLQDYLGENALTPMELLGKLEPRLANRYREAFENPQNKTAWERFAQVDGPFYQQKGDHWTTLTPSGSILTSQNIPMQESTLEAIRKGTSLGPKQAIEELRKIAAQRGQTGLSLEHMTSVQREAFLKDCDFGRYAISEQRKFLSQLVPHAAELRRLILKNCTILNDATLQGNFLRNPNLVFVDLNGSQNVTHSILPALSRMPGLEMVNLSNLSKLRWVANAGLLNYAPISFKRLRALNLNNCAALEAIDLDAPNLTHLWAQGTKKLNRLRLKAAIDDETVFRLLEGYSLKSGQVDIANCPNAGGARKILAALSQPDTKPIDVSDSPIGASGVAILSARSNVETASITYQDLEHFWTQQGKIQTVKAKGEITGAKLYAILSAPSNLKHVDLMIGSDMMTTREQVVEDFEKAGQGDVDAQHRVGMTCFGLKDDDGCREWYQKAADQGDAAAQEIITGLDAERVTRSSDKRERLWTRMRLSIPAARGHEAIYQRFLNGALIYKPDPNSDDGKIVLPIAALANPLEGTFDLSRCGDTGNYLSISTGYRKGKKAENKEKVEIWFTPRFLIEKELNTTAKHFQAIFPAHWNEGAPVGMIWTWGGWDGLSWMDYLTTESMNNLSKIDLYENWKKARVIDWIGPGMRIAQVQGAGHGSFAFCL